MHSLGVHALLEANPRTLECQITQFLVIPQGVKESCSTILNYFSSLASASDVSPEFATALGPLSSSWRSRGEGLDT